MDERTFQRSGRFEYVRADIARMIGRLATETARGIFPLRDAAE
jgi:HEAT repeat protein